MATVLFGKALGFEVVAALFDQPITSFARRAILTSAGAGGHLIRGHGYLRTALRTMAARRRADRPYVIMPGASGPLAVLGYVDAMLELGEQVRRGDAPRPDIIVVPCGSGGTVAGLALGVAMLGWPTLVTAVRITALLASNRLTLRWILRGARRLLEQHGARLLGRPRFAIHHGAIGPGYGFATPEAIAAIPEVERLIGVPGEVTYSGKGIAGLTTIARANPRATILYWHTLSSVRPEVPAIDAVSAPRGFEDVFAGDVAV
jgi:D-cysteine desulfhydrase